MHKVFMLLSCLITMGLLQTAFAQTNSSATVSVNGATGSGCAVIGPSSLKCSTTQHNLTLTSTSSNVKGIIYWGLTPSNPANPASVGNCTLILTVDGRLNKLELGLIRTTSPATFGSICLYYHIHQLQQTSSTNYSVEISPSTAPCC